MAKSTSWRGRTTRNDDVCLVTNRLCLGLRQVAWLDRQSIPLTYEDRRVVDDVRFSVVRSYDTQWNLQIHDVRLDDQGLYRCAVNTNLLSNKVVMLHVQGKSCAYPAMNADAVQLKQLNVCWNTVYRKIFHYNRWESVKCCIRGLRRLDLIHLLAWQKLKFYHQLRHSCFYVFQYLQYDCECYYILQLCAT